MILKAIRSAAAVVGVEAEVVPIRLPLVARVDRLHDRRPKERKDQHRDHQARRRQILRALRIDPLRNLEIDLGHVVYRIRQLMARTISRFIRSRIAFRRNVITGRIRTLRRVLHLRNWLPDDQISDVSNNMVGDSHSPVDGARNVAVVEEVAVADGIVRDLGVHV